jgi:hypothetical protein
MKNSQALSFQKIETTDVDIEKIGATGKDKDAVEDGFGEGVIMLEASSQLAGFSSIRVR